MIDKSYDIVIVGSGAGGGAVASELAPLCREGLRILVLEKGARLLDHEFTGRELDMADDLYEDGGGFLTADGTMTLAFGRAYGGSTVVYTGTSLTAPERVIRAWGVPGLGHADLVRRSHKFAEQNNVHLLAPELLNDNNRLFVEGCARAGLAAAQFPLNLRGCRGSSLCNLGCPNLAKQGTHRVQLPAAERAGVEVVTRADVRRVEDRAVVVHVSARPSGRKGAPSEWQPGDYRVFARVVVLAGGAVGSPALLLRSGFGQRLPRLGAGFTCHPAHILVAEHDRPITNDVGHPKSFYLDRAAEERFVLETCMYFPFTTAKNLTGFGEPHSAWMRAFPQPVLGLFLHGGAGPPDKKWPQPDELAALHLTWRRIDRPARLAGAASANGVLALQFAAPFCLRLAPRNFPRRDIVPTLALQRIRGLASLIGNTPLLAIEFDFHGRRRTIYAKAEHLNMTGSIKDRMAFHILRQAYERGTLRPGDRIAEATSGNTGISFSAIGRALGHPVTIFMPSWMSEERVKLLGSLGAGIRLVSKEEGGFLGSIRLAEDLAKAEDHVFLPRQFSNADNVEAHYLTTGPEIWWQLRFRGLMPDAFVAGVGTGGTIMGAGRFLKERHAAIRLHPLEPANSPTLSTGHKVGRHRIQGISDEFVPPVLDLPVLDRIVDVDDGDAIVMAQKLATELGVGVGISSGANFLGALLVQEELGPDAVVVTVLPDDNKKYLSTGLLQEEPVRSDYLAPRVELLGFDALRRSCRACIAQELGDLQDVTPGS